MSDKIDPEFMKSDESIPEDIDPGIVYDDSKQPTRLPDTKWIHYNYNINGKETISAEEAAQMVLDELKKEEEWYKCDVCGNPVENVIYTAGTYVPFLILCPACKRSIIYRLKLNKL